MTTALACQQGFRQADNRLHRAHAKVRQGADQPPDKDDGSDQRARQENPSPARRKAIREAKELPICCACCRTKNRQNEKACLRSSASPRIDHAGKEIRQILHDREIRKVPPANQQCQARRHAAIGHKLAAGNAQNARKQTGQRLAAQPVKDGIAHHQKQRIERERDQEFRPAGDIRQLQHAARRAYGKGLSLAQDTIPDAGKHKRSIRAQACPDHARQRAQIGLVQIRHRRCRAKIEHKRREYGQVDRIHQVMLNREQLRIAEKLQHVAVDHQNDQQPAAHVNGSVSHDFSLKKTPRSPDGPLGVSYLLMTQVAQRQPLSP